MKKITAVILAFAMCFCGLCVYGDASDDFTIRVDRKDAKPGEIAEVNINMENNTGVLAMLFVLNYDSECLRLVDVKNGAIVSGAVFGNDYNKVPYKMLWNSASDTDYIGDGILATLFFEVLRKPLDGVADITLTYKDKNIYDVNLNPVDIVVVNGSVSITDDEDVSDENSSSENESDMSSDSGHALPSGSVIRPNKNEKDSYEPANDSFVEEDFEVDLLHFVDVRETDWYYEAVKFVFEKSITSGVSETEYAPDTRVTRGQFITMLCRAYGIKETTGENFADCGDTWYTGYLAAAKQLGISNGIGDNKFAPEKEISREEMVTLIYNYLKSIGKVDEEIKESTLSDFNDISDWAKMGVAFAYSRGYVTGKGNNLFDPAGYATRAELAQIFFNMLKNG